MTRFFMQTTVVVVALFLAGCGGGEFSNEAALPLTADGAGDAQVILSPGDDAAPAEDGDAGPGMHVVLPGVDAQAADPDAGGATLPDAGSGGDAAPIEKDAAPSCGPSETLCGGACVNLQTDSDHCGQCGSACTVGSVVTNPSEAHNTCSAGACQFACNGSLSMCFTSAGFTCLATCP